MRGGLSGLCIEEARERKWGGQEGGGVQPWPAKERRGSGTQQQPRRSAWGDSGVVMAVAWVQWRRASWSRGEV
jgi:hypothetical protein